VKYRKTSQ